MNKGKMNGLSLFSGYAGIDYALKEYVQAIGYCDNERYAQAILLSRMDDESADFAPIWTDVRRVDGTKFRDMVDIILAGFPCQGNSVAGKGLGLADERTGLFYEIIRIATETNPTFIFLENVAGIRTKESFVVKRELARIGYDCRWGVVSASSVGANHERKRYFCLAAHSDRIKLRDESWWQHWANRKDAPVARNNGIKKSMANSCGKRLEGLWSSVRICEKQSGSDSIGDAVPQEISHADSYGFSGQTEGRQEENHERIRKSYGWTETSPFERDWWATEPDVGRVANGTAFRKNRVKALGNGVVPLQVKTAFEILMGITA